MRDVLKAAVPGSLVMATFAFVAFTAPIVDRLLGERDGWDMRSTANIFMGLYYGSVFVGVPVAFACAASARTFARASAAAGLVAALGYPLSMLLFGFSSYAFTVAPEPSRQPFIMDPGIFHMTIPVTLMATGLAAAFHVALAPLRRAAAVDDGAEETDAHLAAPPRATLHVPAHLPPSAFR